MMTQIPLQLSGDARVPYRDWPVTQGVPFADGQLQAGTPVRVVDEAGNARPTQSDVLATWHRDRKFVKWLLVDFQADFGAGPPENLFLEYGPDAAPPAHDHAIEFTQQDRQVTFDTGVLRLESAWAPFYVAPTPGHGNPFRRLQVRTGDRWHDLLRNDEPIQLYIRDHMGNVYDSTAAAPRPRVIVEETGPLRACLCITGLHASPGGKLVCPYTLRLHLFAGRRDIRMHHTFVFDQEPRAFEVVAMGVKLPLDVGKLFGSAVGGVDQSYESKNSGTIAMLQRDDLNCEVTVDDESFACDGNTRGWAMSLGESVRPIAVVKDAWQEYPKGFAVDPSGIDVQIWPESYGQSLTFTTPYVEQAIDFNVFDELLGTMMDEDAFVRLLNEHPNAPLNLKSVHARTLEQVLWLEQMVEKHAGDRAVSYNDTDTLDGMGAAKTTQITLHLGDATLGARDAESFAQQVQQPLIAPADPQHTCATGALGHAYHAGDPRFARVDALLDKLFYISAVEPNVFCRRYGMMTYGNMPCGHAKAAPGIAYVHHHGNNDPDKALRWVGQYNNEACDEIMSVWIDFVRTGRRESYAVAQGYSRAVADVGFCHADTRHPEHVGLMHYHNASQWSGGPSPSHSLITGIMWHYYFTGDRRLLEVAVENADWAVNHQTPSGLVYNAGGTLHREFTGPIWSLAEVYQATWHARYADVARRSINWFLRTVSEKGYYPISVYTRGEFGDEAHVHPDPKLSPGRLSNGNHRNIYPLWEIALRLFDSQTLRDHLVAEADQFLWLIKLDTIGYWTPVVCLAYDITGDPKYAAYARHIVDTAGVARLEMLCEALKLGSYNILSDINRLTRTAADGMDRDPAAFDSALQRWQQERAKCDSDPVEIFDPPKVGEVVSIGVLSTADLP
ncbi:MAG: glycoside hydrolase family 127 protein [Phycisphaeraceae bacterium]|nr:glycoside hydrolase family 127 protein [Phycisphaeraceae bacterium]